MHPSPIPAVAAEGAAVPRAVWSSTALQILGRVASSVCQLGVLALLSRRLEGAEFGRLTYYLAFFGFLDVVADFGTGTATLGRGARGAEGLYAALGAGRRVRTATALVASLGALGAALLFREGDAPWIAAAALTFFTRPLELSSLVFLTRIDWRTPVLVRSLAAVARLALALLAAALGARTFGPFLLVHVGCGGLANVLMHLAARGELARGPAFVRERVGTRDLLASALPLALTAILQQAYFYVDNLFVRPLAGEEALGRYNACVRVFSFALLVSSYASSSAFPWLVRRRIAGGTAELGRATLRLFLPLTLVACALLGALASLAAPLLELLFGPGFAGAAPTLRWLCVAAVAVYAGSGCLTAVLATGRMRLVLAITGLGLVANVALNLALVPSRGIEGAALATAGTELVIALASLAVLVAGGARALLHPAWLAGAPLYLGGAWLASWLARAWV